ncbi:pentapeptide repeat-containing protein [Streptosporangium sp. KLBMP 9127]|nr:pentapeptide repeat-containing protein [Streptosporangium sp. KLBMP 9127]
MTPLDVGWFTCAAAPECLGSACEPYGRCLAHLDESELHEIVRRLLPGSEIDLRGTRVDQVLLTRLLSAVGQVAGRARFERAVFTGDVRFCGVTFTGDVSFDQCRFTALASFSEARFEGNVSFRHAVFAGRASLHGVAVRGHLAFDGAVVGSDALFSSARFERTVSFESADLRGFATFDGARFGGTAAFRGCRFGRTVSFRGAAFGGLAGFEAARFSTGVHLTPVSVGRRLALTGAQVGGRLGLTTRECHVDLRGLRALSTVEVRIDAAETDLAGACLHGRATVTGREGARVTSLRGLDAESLELAHVDLSACHFAGIHQPEHLRLTGCTFGGTPRGVHLTLSWPPLRWWTRRNTLADERAFRGWSPPEADPPVAHRLAALYSVLRAGVDDRATAADFRFGAMEMRRINSRSFRRWLLSLYWILSGYGLRTGRMLCWFVLIAAIACASLLLTSASHAGRRAPVTTIHPAG